MIYYQWLGHEITRHDGVAQSSTCSVPYVIDQAIAFMANHNVRVLVVDGQEIRRLER